MYRLSTGIKYSGATEKTGSYLIFQSKESNVETLNSDCWIYAGERPAGTRIYESKFHGQLQIFKKPLADNLAQILFNRLDLTPVKKVHPALEDGFKNEAKRLFSAIDAKINDKYHDFIDFLNQEFELEKNAKSETDLKSYSDDLGPFMMGQIGDRPFVVPELPDFYQAPASWRWITWYINNNFSGPYPINNENTQRFHWNKLKLDSTFKTKYHEGIAYFLIAQFVIIYEAFSNNKSCDSLNLYIDLIKDEGLRPWQKLF